MSASEPKPELLSPAGNWDCARAAVAGGADAIYFGLPAFNARLRADNFTEADLPELIGFLHRHGVRGYVTMNTLVFTGELEAAERQLRLLAEAGVDAIIVQDLGLAIMAREIAPSIELHASTQMTITAPEGLAFAESLFEMERVVLARELSVREIARFQDPAVVPTRTPVEVFVHGALCVAYSGQCLTSESLGQRSANRGECAQACRMPYEIVVDGVTRDLGEHRYLLSPQDLAAVDLIPDLVRAKVRSFKIEGRLKSAEYVAAVTRIYRKALDACQPAPDPEAPAPVTPRDWYTLEMTFSRGLTTGWLAGTNHPYLTHGRFGKKRGPLLGTISACGEHWVELHERTDTPIAAGDGVVFDAGENRDLEQGARIWKLDGERLVFHPTHSSINFSRIRPGHTLYKTSDPKLESQIRKFWQNTRLREQKSPLDLTVTGRPGEPLTAVARTGRQSASARTDSPLEPATRHPLDTETLTKQLGRLGETRYELASLDNRLAGDCHLAISKLNKLRRDLVGALTGGAATPDEQPAGPSTASHRDFLPAADQPPAPGPPQLSVLCRTLAQVTAALESRVAIIYCDFEDPRRYRDAVKLARTSGDPATKLILATPRIIKPGETEWRSVKPQDRADLWPKPFSFLKEKGAENPATVAVFV